MTVKVDLSEILTCNIKPIPGSDCMKWTVPQYIHLLGSLDLAVCLSDLKQCFLGGTKPFHLGKVCDVAYSKGFCPKQEKGRPSCPGSQPCWTSPEPQHPRLDRRVKMKP